MVPVGHEIEDAHVFAVHPHRRRDEPVLPVDAAQLRQRELHVVQRAERGVHLFLRIGGGRLFGAAGRRLFCAGAQRKQRRRGEQQCDDLFEHGFPSLKNYPFSPPILMPPIICFWKMRKSTMGRTVMHTAIAILALEKMAAAPEELNCV